VVHSRRQTEQVDDRLPSRSVGRLVEVDKVGAHIGVSELRTRLLDQTPQKSSSCDQRAGTMKDVQRQERSRVRVPHGPVGGFVGVCVCIRGQTLGSGRARARNERTGTLVSTHISAVNFQLLW